MSIYENVAEAYDDVLIDAALQAVSHVPYWLDDPERPAALPALEGTTDADLLVVGGGYSGLWTALMAKERDPERSVVLIESHRVGWAASGRNGGFCEASLVHGDSNGRQHLPEENDLLRELGLENLRELAEAVERYGIDCEFTFSGVLKLATEEHQVQWLRDEVERLPRAGVPGPPRGAGEREVAGVPRGALGQGTAPR